MGRDAPENTPNAIHGVTRKRRCRLSITGVRANLFLWGSLSMLKRCMDVLGAALGLLVLSPLLATIALLVFLTFGGPIFYWQQRTGFREKPFWIVKFRTMREIQDAEGR